MAEEEEFSPYKDISELKRGLEAIKDKKDVSTKELYDAVLKLAQTINDMLEVFGAAAEQMKLEEKELETETRKHEIIVTKLDKLVDQNKTIAEGMVAIVDMVKERLPEKKEQSLFKAKEEEPPIPAQEPQLFKPAPEWKPKPEIKPMPAQPMSFSPELGMPPMQPTPAPDLDFPEDPFDLGEAEPKKKSLFGMFKK